MAHGPSRPDVADPVRFGDWVVFYGVAALLIVAGLLVYSLFG